MIAKTFGAAVYGVKAALITIEVSILQGIGTSVVGLYDNTVQESLHRIDAALKNSGYQPSRQKMVINLTPADIDKEDSAYDLPITLCILAASGEISFKKELSDYVILGELGSDGQLRSVKGVLPIAIEARKRRCRGLILPLENALEASIVNQLDVYGVRTLQEAVSFLQGMHYIELTVSDTRDVFFNTSPEYEADFSQVHGQESNRRAMEIAAAGGHGVIMIGSSGADKTALAKRLPSILPPLTLHESLETTKIYSVAGRIKSRSMLITHRPYRNPHHSINDEVLLGRVSQPGEVSLAHNGVLFLEELPEFEPTVLKALRQPLEARKVVISDTREVTEFPASFMLITSMDSCPCGYRNHPNKACVCNPDIVQQYFDTVNSLLPDCIDLHVKVTPIEVESTSSAQNRESSLLIRERVIQARERQLKRFSDSATVYTNAMMPDDMVRQVCVISEAGRALLKRAIERFSFSPRAHDQSLKIARTIADLSHSDDIRIEHLAEAIQYRSLDRTNQGG